MKRLCVIILAIAALCTVLPSAAQRQITPVKSSSGLVGTPAEKTKEEVDKSKLLETHDAQGNIIFVDTITGKEWVDTTAVSRVPKMIYPLMEGVTVGVNVFDPVMKIFGQHYGGIDFWAELSLHNRYKPIVEFGLSSCNDTPDGSNFKFKSPMAPYFKIGANYNIFYNNSPNYQLTVGLRYGFTNYKYEVTAVMDEEYWGDPSKFTIPRQSSTAGYIELVVGVKVMIYKNFSLGWNIKYHTLMHESKAKFGKPMYIPGYGTRNMPIGAGFSLIYTFTLNKPDEALVSKKKKK